MRSLNILLIALVGIALASSELAQSDWSTVLVHLSGVEPGIAALNRTFNKFSPGWLDVVGALAILGASNGLASNVTKATHAAGLSPPFGQQGSDEIAMRVLDLQDPIESLMRNIVAKKSGFDRAFLGFIPLTSIVAHQLKAQKNATDTLSAAIVPKLSEAFQRVAPTIVKRIDKAFDKAIAVYTSKG